MPKCRCTCKRVAWWFQFFVPVVVAFPFLFNLIVLEDEKPKASPALGVTIITALWWILEPIPIVITAFFPVFLLPLFNISSASNVASAMFSDTSMVFLGGFIFSTAMVRWNLHSRIALKTVLIFGLRPRILLLGIMIVTAFLSMWISNTATALTMVPNVLAIVTKLEEMTGDPEIVAPFAKSLFLTIAFSASIGGMATLIGTPPNLIMTQFAKSLFPDAPEIGFAQFLFVALPTAVIILVIMYLFFIFVYMRKLSLPDDMDETVFRDSYKKLGKMKAGEIVVLVTFIALALLWLFRADLSFSETATLVGWANRLFSGGSKTIADGTVAIALAMLLFIIHVPQPTKTEEIQLMKGEVDLAFGQKPVPWAYKDAIDLYDVADEDSELVEDETTFHLEDDQESSDRPSKEWVPVLEWEYAQQKIPWTILFLFSGGFALNQGFTDSQLDQWLGDTLKGLTNLPEFALILVICIVTSVLSNIASNTACANILLPIVAIVAKNAQKYHPWILMMPCAFATSCCFIMPVATPPNLICYGSGRLTMKDFIIAGSIINLMSLLVVAAMSVALILSVFQAHGFPDWAMPTTNTSSMIL